MSMPDLPNNTGPLPTWYDMVQNIRDLTALYSKRDELQLQSLAGAWKELISILIKNDQNIVFFQETEDGRLLHESQLFIQDQINGSAHFNNMLVGRMSVRVGILRPRINTANTPIVPHNSYEIDLTPEDIDVLTQNLINSKIKSSPVPPIHMTIDIGKSNVKQDVKYEADASDPYSVFAWYVSNSVTKTTEVGVYAFEAFKFAQEHGLSIYYIEGLTSLETICISSPEQFIDLVGRYNNHRTIPESMKIIVTPTE